MSVSSQKFLWVCLILAIAAGLVWQFFPLQDAKERLDHLPIKGIAYQGKKIPLNETEKEIFSKNHVLKRVYKIDNSPYFVTMIDGTGNRHVVHDPHFCFSGAGWEVVGEETVSAPKGKLQRVKLKRGDEEREALYWFTDGSRQYSSPWLYWWQTTMRRLTLGYSGAEPVLVMIQPLEKEDPDWNEVAQDFQPLFRF